MFDKLGIDDLIMLSCFCFIITLQSGLYTHVDKYYFSFSACRRLASKRQRHFKNHVASSLRSLIVSCVKASLKYLLVYLLRSPFTPFSYHAWTKLFWYEEDAFQNFRSHRHTIDTGDYFNVKLCLL